MKRHHSRDHHPFNAETLALGYGYEPLLSEGALKPPVFLTSTFLFRTAEEGARFFRQAYGLEGAEPGPPGLIYSRLNNPNLQMFEERMAAWDRTEAGAVFASGMAAIATSLLALLRPGDRVVHSAPLYGGTHYLLHHVLPSLGIHATAVPAGSDTVARMAEAVRATGDVRLLLLETPSNPSIVHVDIAGASRLAAEASTPDRPVLTMVDNTFLGPVFQRPADFGADLVVTSATKFIGGHSDLVAGVVTGRREPIERITMLRTAMGTMATPFTGWLLLRSLETVSVRMRRQAKTARRIAERLAGHPRVARVRYPTLLPADDPQRAIWEHQCTGPGSLIAFDVRGGQREAFRVLDRFELFRLAVSLGGTESLVEHPMTMTHADVPPEELARLGVGPGTIRMSVGLEHESDLLRDLEHALDAGGAPSRGPLRSG